MSSNDAETTEGVVAWKTMWGGTALDVALVCLFVVGLAAVMSMYLDHLTREARETALRMGLRNIRISLNLYHALNQRYPENLQELLTTGYRISSIEDTIFSDRYLSAQVLDGEGHPVDPFGQRYRYDPEHGRVSSGKEGYQQW